MTTMTSTIKVMIMMTTTVMMTATTMMMTATTMMTKTSQERRRKNMPKEIQ